MSQDLGNGLLKWKVGRACWPLILAGDASASATYNPVFQTQVKPIPTLTVVPVNFI